MEWDPNRSRGPPRTQERAKSVLFEASTVRAPLEGGKTLASVLKGSLTVNLRRLQRSQQVTVTCVQNCWAGPLYVHFITNDQLQFPHLQDVRLSSTATAVFPLRGSLFRIYTMKASRHHRAKGFPGPGHPHTPAHTHCFGEKFSLNSHRPEDTVGKQKKKERLWYRHRLYQFSLRL